MPVAEDVVAEVARARGPRRSRAPSRCRGQRVLAADVEVAVLAAGREAGDRHRLDQRERVVLHQHAVLERARLGLVGVADRRSAGAPGWRATASHLTPGRERRAAAAQQLRVGDLADHARRARARSRARSAA